MGGGGVRDQCPTSESGWMAALMECAALHRTGAACSVIQLALAHFIDPAIGAAAAAAGTPPALEWHLL